MIVPFFTSLILLLAPLGAPFRQLLPSGIPILGGSQTNNVTEFTLKKSAQQQSQVTGPAACPTQYVTFNVTRTKPVEDTVDFSFHDTCAVLAPQPPPANPYSFKVNDTIASSISAIITASACTTPVAPAGVTAHLVLSSGCLAPSGQTSLGSPIEFWRDGLFKGSLGVFIERTNIGYFIAMNGWSQVLAGGEHVQNQMLIYIYI